VKMKGFTLENSKTERQIERKLKSLPKPDNCKRYLKHLTKEPHIAGTEENYKLALYVRDRFEEFGLEDVELVEYQVLLSYPEEITVEIVEPVHYRASLREDGYSCDEESSDSQVSIGFNAYSASGEVTAPLVYAHGGSPEDYDKLDEMGVDIRGKVALVRYSMPYSYRGCKAFTAQKRGAAGLLIYSDPMEDGYMKGDVYPHGPWGPESHIQRGGIPFDFFFPGDPLTPGWASVKGAKRIKPEESQVLPKIISVPLSHKDASQLLKNLSGPVAPHSWQGGLPFTYRVGPGSTKVHMKVKMEDPIRSIWNVLGKVKGSENPDKWVVVGNHRDAWVYGATDPNSGTASLLELARALGTLTKEGYRPKRSIVFCNWDAEEYTLTGSTEWVEQETEKLIRDGVAYINVDIGCCGPNFWAKGVACLKELLPSIAKEVMDPNSGKSLYDAWKKYVEKNKLASSEKNEIKRSLCNDDKLSLMDTRVGSGSDHTAFLNFVCMPVIDMGFTGPCGVYHSQYDNFHWMSRFGDPQFRYHATMSVIWGIAALRLANASILPFDYAPYAEEISGYINEIEKMKGKTLTPEINSLFDKLSSFEDYSCQLNAKIEEFLDSAGPIDPDSLELINTSLMRLERCFANPEGLPKRPWFKHLIYAPKLTYAPEVLPGITEALEDEDWARAKEQIHLLGNAIDKANETLLTALRKARRKIT
jgi:N-acetylated-alpha-linked acidic dipeptidase